LSQHNGPITIRTGYGFHFFYKAMAFLAFREARS
jgi:hypothetical protein